MKQTECFHARRQFVLSLPACQSSVVFCLWCATVILLVCNHVIALHPLYYSPNQISRVYSFPKRFIGIILQVRRFVIFHHLVINFVAWNPSRTIENPRPALSATKRRRLWQNVLQHSACKRHCSSQLNQVEGVAFVTCIHIGNLHDIATCEEHNTTWH